MIRRALAFVAVLALAASAQAQTYIRPSNGATINLFTTVNYNSGNTDSQVFGMSGFQGVQFFVKTTGASCSKVPAITVFGAAVATFASADFDFPMNGQNSYFAYKDNSTNSTYQYNVAPIASFIVVRLNGITNPNSNAGTTCTATVKMIPLALPLAATATTPHSTQSAVTAAATKVTEGGGITGSNRPNATTTIQNQSLGVIYCDFDAGVTTSTYAIALKACTVAGDGTGGSWTLTNYNGRVYCIATAGSVTLCGGASCAVTSYAY
jgi:hypothetical protein